MPWSSFLRAPRRLGTLIRYCAVSAVSTSTSLITLGLLVGVIGSDATLANVVATASLWILQFVLLDRILFRQGDQPAPAPANRGTPVTSEAMAIASDGAASAR